MKTFTIGKKKIVLKEEWMVGFITTWIVGLLAHAYRFFNFLPIWDSIYNFTGVGSTYTLGRWFLGYAGLITSMFDLPWINGAFSLFYISIVVILLTEMFEIKNKGMIVLCAAIFVSFPTVVSSFAYMYTADAYLLAFLLATLAVYLTWCVKKWGTIAGMVCLAFAMGIYQAYATVVIVLVLLYIIRQFVIEKLDFLEAVRKDLKYLGMLVGGAVLYAVILKITLIRYNITLPGYQGIGALAFPIEIQASPIGVSWGSLNLCMNPSPFRFWTNNVESTHNIRKGIDRKQSFGSFSVSLHSTVLKSDHEINVALSYDF